MDEQQVRALIAAAARADWQQVILNGGPPCFHLELERGRFCLRAARWAGHGPGEWPMHPFVSLSALLESLLSTPPQAAEGKCPRHEEAVMDEQQVLALIAEMRIELRNEWADKVSSLLVTTTLAHPDMVAHPRRLDCEHEMPHLMAACGAFKHRDEGTR